MIKATVLALALALPTATASLAGDFGSAEEARSMLDRAITEVETDPAAALAKFNSGEDGFRDRDLYVFCWNVDDGILSAHPALLGDEITSLKDKNDFAMGQQMFDTASEGVVSEISYFWPRPDETEPVQKRSFYTRIGGQGCGVGYYE